MSNLVEILVVSKNMTKPAFDEAKAGIGGLGAAAAGMAIAVGAALAAVAVKSVEMASTFDAEITKLNTQAGVAKDQLAGLSKGVLDLAGQVGQSPDSLAQALFHVESNFASLGISSQKALALLKVAAEGASVGGANLVDVTNALTAAVASGIPGVEDFQKAMGVLNATVGAGDMTMQDLAKALGTGFLATVKGFGLSITDVGAALAVFGDNNIRGAKAGTQLRMAVQALAVPTKDGKALLEQYGMSADQLAKDMQSGGLLKALQDLKTHLDAAGVSGKQQGEILTTMFGKRAGVGVNILFDQLTRLESKYPDLAKGANKFGDAWATTSATLKQQWADLKAGFDALLIKLGEGLEPIIQKLIPLMRDGFNKVLPILREVAAKFQFGDSIKQIEKDSEQFVQAIKEHWPEIRQIVALVGAEIFGIIKFLLMVIDITIRLDTIMVSVWSGFVKVVDRAALALLDMISKVAGLGAKIPGPFQDSFKQVAHDAAHMRDEINSAINGINRNIQIHTVERIDVIVRQQFGAIAGHASGGIVGAASGGIRSNLVMVGEHGRELLDLAPGTQVHSNPDTERMLAGAPSSGVQWLQLGSSDPLMRSFIKELQRHVRNMGGDSRVLGIRKLSTT